MPKMRLLWIVVSTIATGCTSYSQAVTDTNYGLIYVSYSKSFLGMTTGGGVLTCVPNQKSLRCVEKLVIGTWLPCTSRMSETSFACNSEAGTQPKSARRHDAAASLPTGSTTSGSQAVERAAPSLATTQQLDPMDQRAEQLRSWIGERVLVEEKDMRKTEGQLVGLQKQGERVLQIDSPSGLALIKMNHIKKIRVVDD
jgi:hypothetical protein